MHSPAFARRPPCPDRVDGRAATHGSRSFGKPSFTSWPCGPLLSYRRIDDSPLDNATSRIGTRTPCGPSTNTLCELGNAVANSDIFRTPSVRLRPQGCGATRFQGSILNLAEGRRPARSATPGGGGYP